MTGTINANAGTIGGFSIGQGRIGSTASGSGSGGGLVPFTMTCSAWETPPPMSFSGRTRFRHPQVVHAPPAES
ncbi:hypothetical protein NXV13_10700 [Bacteroides ovatus]|nr:hypothetical protein [Bacteroides ovatus]